MSLKNGTSSALEASGAPRKQRRLFKTKQKSIDASVYLIIALMMKILLLKPTLTTLSQSQKPLKDKNRPKNASRLEV